MPKHQTVRAHHTLAHAKATFSANVRSQWRRILRWDVSTDTLSRVDAFRSDDMRLAFPSAPNFCRDAGIPRSSPPAIGLSGRPASDERKAIRPQRDPPPPRAGPIDLNRATLPWAPPRRSNSR